MIGSSNTMEIGCATPTVMPSEGKELAAVLLLGTTVVKVLWLWFGVPVTFFVAEVMVYTLP